MLIDVKMPQPLFILRFRVQRGFGTQAKLNANNFSGPENSKDVEQSRKMQ